MKKITLLLLFCTSLTFGQVLISENFENGLSLPSGWTNNEITAIGNIWTFETGGFAKFFDDSNTIFYSEGGFSGNYAIFDSDEYGAGPEEAALESPVFDCTGLTNIKITFNHLFVSGANGAGYVEVYNGSSWIEITSYSETNVTADTYIAGSVTLDATTELADVPNARVRFRWVGDYSYYWALDDIIVQQPNISVPDPVITPNPANGATDVVLISDTDYNGDLTIDENDFAYIFSWENAPTGETPEGYVFYLGTSSTPNPIADINSNSLSLYGLEYSTTYYWAVGPYNIAGNAPSASLWSFTTEANPSLSIEDKTLEIVRAYPNPVKDLINIDTDTTIDSAIIFNQIGQQVMDVKSDNIVNNSIDLSRLNKGLYIMTIKSEGKSTTLKIIKE